MQVLAWIGQHPVAGMLLALIASNFTVQILKAVLILAGKHIK